MKKVALALSLLAVVLAGCGPDQKAAADPKNGAEPPKPVDVSTAGGS